MPFSQKTVAIVYDFDKTLSPKDMQEFGIFEQINTTSGEFWPLVHNERDKTQAEELLVYMKLMIEAASRKGNNLTRDKLREHGKNIEFFDGVISWFDRVNAFVENLAPDSGISVEHYIVSSGLFDMIDTCAIRKHFKAVYACEFIYNDSGAPVWPARLVTDAAKTQYIFRINKGLADPNDKSVNQHMPEVDRRVPFSNLMYIGDSDTDIPSMNVVMKNGGHSIAVFDPSKRTDSAHMEKMSSLKAAKRVDFYCAADYSEGSVMENLVFNTLDVIVKRIQLREKIFNLSPCGHLVQ